MSHQAGSITMLCCMQRPLMVARSSALMQALRCQRSCGTDNYSVIALHACIAGSIDPSQVPAQCGNADWLAPAHTVGMQPLSAASHRVTRLETEAAVDEFTAEIPAKCHVGVICGRP